MYEHSGVAAFQRYNIPSRRKRVINIGPFTEHEHVRKGAFQARNAIRQLIHTMMNQAGDNRA